MTEYLPCGFGPWAPIYGEVLRVRVHQSTRLGQPWRIYIHDRDDYDTEAFYATEEEAMAALEELRKAPITPERLDAMGFAS